MMGVPYEVHFPFFFCSLLPMVNWPCHIVGRFQPHCTQAILAALLSKAPHWAVLDFWLRGTLGKDYDRKMYRSQVPRFPNLGKLIFGSYSSFSVCLPSVASLAVCSVDHVTYSANGMLLNMQAKTQGHCVCLLCCSCSSAFTMWPCPHALLHG